MEENERERIGFKEAEKEGEGKDGGEEGGEKVWQMGEM